MPTTAESVAQEFSEHLLVFETELSKLALSLCLLILLYSLFLSYKSLVSLSKWKKYLLFGLRSLLASALFFVLLQPNCQSRRSKYVANTVLIAIDVSKSMEHFDGQSISRLENAYVNARKITSKIKADSKGRYKSQLCIFADEAELIESKDLQSFDSFQKRVALLAEKRSQSRLLSPFSLALKVEHLAGLVLLSDGADSSGLSVPLSAGEVEQIKALKVPVHTIYIESQTLYKDVALLELKADQFAFVHNVLKIDVLLEQYSFAGQPIEIILSQDGDIIARKELILSKESKQKVQLSVKVKEAGQHVYTVRIPALAGEDILSNNQKVVLVKVIRDRMRVLLVAGHPSWDVRFMRQMLKENPSVDLISFFILRSVTDKARAANKDLSLIPFPTKELFTEQLNTFDVVIFQDFNFQPYHMSSYLKNIHEFVVKNGGGFLMLGGALTFSEAAYQKTLIADLLPVELSEKNHAIDTQEFRPIKTKAGELHPILDIEELSSAEKMAVLPKLEGLNLVESVKEDAQVLLAHPFVNADHTPHPVLAIREVGEGRTAVLMTDSLWKWALPAVATGSRGDLQRQLVANILRWLIKDPQLSRLHLDLSEEIVQQGAPLTASILSLNGQYEPLNEAQIKIKITALTGKKNVRNFAGVTNVDGRLRKTIEDLENGAYRIEAESSAVGEQKSTAESIFLVESKNLESQFIFPIRANLQAISAASNAQLIDRTKVDDVSVRQLNLIDHHASTMLEQKSDPLWNRWYFLLFMVTLAAVEWTLRRQSGLK